MANDVTIVSAGGANSTVSRVYRVEAGAAASIAAGKPVKVGGTDANYAVLLATGDPEQDVDRMIGISSSISTDTAAADGTVNIDVVVPGVTVLRCAATTPANIDTDAKLLAILNDSVTFDYTAPTYTIDEDEGDDPNVHGLIIIGGDIAAGTLDVVLHNACTQSGSQV